MKKVMLGLALLVVGNVASAQTTYKSLYVQSEPGGSPRGTFFFGHSPNGTVGTTVLNVQCDYKRAWLITDYGTTQQLETEDFPVDCSNPMPSGPYTVDHTPLSVTLMLHNSNGVEQRQITLTVVSAEFTESSRWKPATGSAEITF